MLGVLESHYGDIHSIMGRLIFAHKSLGKIPSHGASREHILHLVNEHYRIIKGVKDLGAEERNEKLGGENQELLGNHQQLVLSE